MDEVSETCRCEWDKVWAMNIVEFFNVLAYGRDKAAERERAIKHYKSNG